MTSVQETRALCDWGLSVFGRIQFSPAYSKLCNGHRGVVLVDLSVDEMLAVREVVTARKNAGALVDRAQFVATDDSRMEIIHADLSDPEQFDLMVTSATDGQYVVSVRLSGGNDASALEKCIRWALVSDQVVTNN